MSASVLFSHIHVILTKSGPGHSPHPDLTSSSVGQKVQDDILADIIRLCLQLLDVIGLQSYQIW